MGARKADSDMRRPKEEGAPNRASAPDTDRPDANQGRRRDRKEVVRGLAGEAPSRTLKNSIRPAKRLLRAEAAGAPAQAPLWKADEVRDRAAPPRPDASPPGGDASAEAVPEEIRRRFVQVGKTFFFPDGAKAFVDRGRKLTTPSENTEVIRSLVGIAQARGWSEITVRGSERFRKEAWAAAQLAGLAARGYAPSDFERAHLARTLARKADPERPADPARASPSGVAEPQEAAPASKRDRHGTLLLGRLVDHGHATYKHDPQQPMSYFVKIETGRGERTIWGVDLERALRESLTRPSPGDEIGLRSVRRDVVTVKTETRDAAGRAAGQKDLATHRNRWIVEKRELFDERADAARTLRDAQIEPRRGVRSHPELAGTYLYLRGAQEIAAKRIRDPEDRKKFVAIVRGALADSVERGEPLAVVRLRERPPAQRTTRSAERDPTR